MPAVQDTEPDLRAAIRERFGTAHKFCRITGLPRGTVYQVLAGRYAGNMEKQTQRIWAVLGASGHDTSPETGANIQDVLARIACALCAWKGRCTRRRSRRCAATHEQQAKALVKMLAGGSHEHHPY